MGNIIHFQSDGKIKQASVTEVSHRHHSMFKVLFGNNYENVFYTDVETGKWIEEDLGFTQLASQVGEQIKKIMKNPYHVPKILTWHKQFVDHKLVSFGFFNFMKGRHKMYEIYSNNKKYMYTLVDMDNEEWQILGNSNLVISKIDPIFVQQVIEILPLYSANA